MLKWICKERGANLEDLKKIIGNNITALRTSAKLTQSELADKLNYSDKSVSKWERGESAPDIFILKQIADLFGVMVDYLLLEEHCDDSLVTKKMLTKRSRYIITALSVLGVWLIATMVFTVLHTMNIKGGYIAFLAAIPLMMIDLLVFNSIWGNKKLNILFISGILWGTILLVYILLIKFDIWLLFIIGAICQVALLITLGFFKHK